MRNQLHDQYHIFRRTFALTCLLFAGAAAQATDLSIYQPGGTGQVTLTMMLDTTGSMGDGSINTDYGVTCTVSGTTVPAVVTNGQSLPSYTARSCTSGGVTYYTRFTRLQQGMFDALASTQGTISDVYMALGNFSAKGDSKTGQIIVPAARLGVPSSTTCNAAAVTGGTANQRCKLAYAISQLTAAGSTSTANAFAEAGAYMLGTNTYSTTTTQDLTIAVDSVLIKDTSTVTIYAKCNDLRSSNTQCRSYNNWVADTTTAASSAASYYTCPSGNLLATDTTNFVQLCTGDTYTSTDSQYQSATLPGTSGWVASGGVVSTTGMNPNASYTLSSTITPTGAGPEGASGPAASRTTPVTSATITYPCTAAQLTKYGSLAQCARVTTQQTTVYSSNVTQSVPLTTTSTDSGMANALTNNATYPGIFPTGTTAIGTGVNYQSPLPNNTVTCNGQGVYVLSDGQPNADGITNAQGLMTAALGNKGSIFKCSPDAATGQLVMQNNGAGGASAAWSCMGSFAQALFDKNKNPSGKSLLTAFVGFGKSFAGFTPGVTTSTFYADTLNSCMLGSRPGTADACAAWNAGRATTTLPNSFYGQGGYYVAQKASDVTGSVLGFIGTLSTVSVSPLVTGAATVPVDTLNPNGFESVGYFQAVSPNPGNSSKLSWSGDIKKYNIAGGALVGQGGTSDFILNKDGTFATAGVDSKGSIIPSTYELWNNLAVLQSDGTTSAKPDGGLVVDTTSNNVNYPGAGTYGKIKIPTTTNEPTGTNAPTAFRPLFSDLDSNGAQLTTSGNLLAFAPAADTTAANNTNANDVWTLFNSAPYSTLALLKQKAILNYLGYNVPLDATAFPSAATLASTVTAVPFKAQGATIHSAPVQLSYKGTLNASGDLQSGRIESLLFGSMDGALHLVDATTTTGGGEQMVFVPNDVLSDSIALQALQPNATNAAAAPTTATAPQAGVLPLSKLLPYQGLDGAWVVDPNYRVVTTTVSGVTSSTLTANQMNVYGGMRMGGSSYYGLDLCSPSTTNGPCTLPSDSGFQPKLLFRLNATKTGFGNMGQSWSKPVLANVRFKDTILRVVIIGGGYDVCYEDPFFYPGQTAALNAGTAITGCNSHSPAAGNAIYMVSAKAQSGYTAGQLIWEATSTLPTLPTNAVGKANTNMINSIVAPASVVDRDADGLIDQIYFADLGGQVFRADFNNKIGTADTAFNVRVVRLANFASTSLIAAGNVPRFYHAPVLSFEVQPSFAGSTAALSNSSGTFMLVSVASGDRATPLDVLATNQGGLSISRIDNNVYGIIDRDFSKSTLTTDTALTMDTQDKTLSNLVQNPQSMTASSNLVSTFFPSTGVTSSTPTGWYRSIGALGTDLTGGTRVGAKTSGGIKAYEQPISITNMLFLSVFDPEGVDVVQNSTCTPRVVGQSTSESFCLPYGACVGDDGTLDTTKERKQGAQLVVKTIVTNTDGTTTTNYSPNLLGAGIRGIALAGTTPTPSTTGACPGFTIVGNQAGLGAWTCSRKLVPTRWYEKQPNPARVN